LKNNKHKHFIKEHTKGGIKNQLVMLHGKDHIS